jgi:hypothetical protein
MKPDRCIAVLASLLSSRVVSIRAEEGVALHFAQEVRQLFEEQLSVPRLQEVGCAVKIAFLLRSISGPSLRCRITAATNRAEPYNSFSD